MRYLFRGTLLIPDGRIRYEVVKVLLQPGIDYPGGELQVEIKDNAIIGQFDTPSCLEVAEAATLRNIVKDVAAGACRCLAIIEGTWGVATVNFVRAEDGSLELQFDERAHALKREFANRGITRRDVIRVTEHPDGYYLRNAINNITVGLMEPQLASAQFYCALEALKTSMAPTATRAQQWLLFRSTLGVTQTQIEVLEDHALRHGDYGNATPITGAEMEAALAFLGEIVCKYVAWFKHTKLSATDVRSSQASTTASGR